VSVVGVLLMLILVVVAAISLTLRSWLFVLSPRVLIPALLLLASGTAGAAGRFDRGLLWEISRPGIPPCHIFGTVHLPDVRLLPLPDPVLDAFQRSRSFGMELYPSEQAGLRFFEAGELEDGRRLDQIIGEESFRRLQALAAQRGLAPEAVPKFKPWAALLIVLPQRDSDGLPSLDQELFLQARARRMNIEQLDAVEEQIAVFDGIPESTQVALLRFYIDHHGEMHRIGENTLRAYLRRDLAGLAQANAAMEVQYPAIKRHNAILKKKVIDDRSVAMAFRMLPQLRHGGAFFAVGALHLYGKKGMLALLEKDGWRVRRVY
jgi:uncharacterized protein YbaP (TraB family)